MKPRLPTVLTLAASWAILLCPQAAFADTPKEAELQKRIEQLEKRVADLELAIKKSPSVKKPATTTEKNLIGNWTITDDAKKTAIAKKLPLVPTKSGRVVLWTDLNMKADGICALVMRGEPYTGATYQVTVIGSVTSINIEWAPSIIGGGNPAGKHPIAGYSWDVRIASVSEKELVLQLKSGAEWVELQYTRAK